jgi:hypothetical protein
MFNTCFDECLPLFFDDCVVVVVGVDVVFVVACCWYRRSCCCLRRACCRCCFTGNFVDVVVVAVDDGVVLGVDGVFVVAVLLYCYTHIHQRCHTDVAVVAGKSLCSCTDSTALPSYVGCAAIRCQAG